MNSRRALVTCTVAYTVCFSAWVLNAVLVNHLSSAQAFPLSGSQVAWLLAAPILTGALTRFPLGMLADRFGGRMVLTVVLGLVSVVLLGLSTADSFGGYLAWSLALGLAGGGFAVGVAYVSVSFEKGKQGAALGIFGMSNLGAALTTALAPQLLGVFDSGDPDSWRRVAQVYAAALAVAAVGFALLAPSRLPRGGQRASLAARLRPLRDRTVWHLCLYYTLTFGAFVALSQWLVTYGIGAYGLSVAGAGLLASAFSLPVGLSRTVGGWLSDRNGPGPLMNKVFLGAVLLCAVLAVPRLDVLTPGQAVTAKSAGVVEAVTPTAVTVSGVTYPLTARPAETVGETDDGGALAPKFERWQEPIVAVGDHVAKKQQLARGVTNAYYPANVWIFAGLAVLLGLTLGLGSGGVFKAIADSHPHQVGTVGGAVAMIGALGGFALPLLFTLVLKLTGTWASAWWVLAVLALSCLVLLRRVHARIMEEEAPDLQRLLDRSHIDLPLSDVPGLDVETLLARVPFFSGLTHEELVDVAEIGEVHTARAGEEFFRIGERGDALYLLLAGEVTGPRSGVLSRISPGEFFGDIVFLDGGPRVATATAITDSRVFVIERQAFLGLLHRSPRLMADMLRTLSGRPVEAVLTST